MNRKRLAVMAAALLLFSGCGVTANDTPPQDGTPGPGYNGQEASPEPTPTPTPAPTPTPEPEIPATDFGAFKAPEELDDIPDPPDFFTMLSGESVETEWDYKVRMQEIRDLYQYYMYGFWPDRAEETVTYAFDGDELTVTVGHGGKTASFNAIVSLPGGPAPEGGYPVIIALSLAWGDSPLGHGIPYQYANDNGYAVISFNTPMLAADDSSRTGAFYDLYPYDKDDVFKQTGTLMAWGWGGSKIIDALENGLSAETGISAENTILTGVSRYGKAAFVAGAFDERVRVTMPASSGAGGASMYRSNPRGNVYDYSSLGGPDEKITTGHEGLQNLQGGFPHWFNDMLLRFPTPARLPVEQHMLAALCGTNGRFLFITSETDTDWLNPAGTHATFASALDIYTRMGAPERIGINMHWTGHAVLEEDLEKVLPFCDYHFYGRALPFGIGEVQTTVYDLEVNRK